MKKSLLLLALLVLVVFLASCNSFSATSASAISPDATQTATAAHVTETQAAANEEATLTEDQREMIVNLLSGALSMEDYGVPAFFDDATALSTEILLGFAYNILINTPVISGFDYMDTETVSSEVIIDIISSAFGIDYSPKKGDGEGSLLSYNGRSFDVEGSDGSLLYPSIYRITRMSSGDLTIQFNISNDGPPDSYYLCDGEAVIQEDADSLFGYHLVSLKKVISNLAFIGAEASSNLPSNGTRTYNAENAIDGDDNSAWAASGTGESIKLSFDTPEDISGMILHLGDLSNIDAYYENSTPLAFDIRFSDGTIVSCEDFEVNDPYGDHFVTFDKVINTSYVEITITDILEGTAGAGGGVYISDIRPF